VVSKAGVQVAGKVVGGIGTGIMALVGIRSDDSAADREWIMQKICTGKYFRNSEGIAWRSNVKDAGGAVLLVSQFTLYGSMKKTRPDFRLAMGGEQAEKEFELLVAGVSSYLGVDEHGCSRVATGEFGAMMSVELTNEGPITIVLDSRDRKGTGSVGTETRESGEPACAGGSSALPHADAATDSTPVPGIDRCTVARETCALAVGASPQPVE